MPFDMVEWVQSTGRIGRDKVHAVAHLLLKADFKMAPTAPGNHAGVQHLYDTVYDDTPLCFRERIHMWMDDYPYNCELSPDDLDVIACSSCNFDRGLEASTFRRDWHSQISPNRVSHTLLEDYRHTPASSTPGPVDPPLSFAQAMQRVDLHRIERTQTVSDLIQTFVAAKTLFTHECSYCFCFPITERLSHMPATPRRHGLFRCNTLENYKTKDGIKAYKTFRFFPYRVTVPNHVDVCFSCHMPQVHDDVHLQNPRAGNPSCTHRDLVGPVLYGVFKNADLFDKARLDFPTIPAEEVAYRQWCVQGPTGPGDVYQTNAIALFVWWYKAFCS